MSDIPINCHGDVTQGGIFKFKPPVWEAAQPHHPDGWQGYVCRHCSHCGSIQPEDLVKALTAGAVLEGADWKYGWPHKFYIRGIPNPIAGETIKVGASTDAGAIMGVAAATAGMKWYNEHLADLPDDLFNQLTTLLHERGHILFSRDERGLKYRAPHAGYQA